MAAAGAPAARCLTILLTLAVLLSHPGQALKLQAVQGAGAAAVEPPSYEELTSSLLVNQIAILQLLQDPSNAASACPDGWFRHEFSCYLVYGTSHTWEESLAYCKGLGGDLAKITSAEEQEFIKGKIQEHSDVWIGLNDRATEGHFVWTDGSAATYTAWDVGKGQPYDPTGLSDCVHMVRNRDYKWHDDACNSGKSRFVCERPIFA